MSTNDQTISSSFVAMLAQSASASEASSASSSQFSSSTQSGDAAPAAGTSGMVSVSNPFLNGLSATTQELLKDTLTRSPF